MDGSTPIDFEQDQIILVRRDTLRRHEEIDLDRARALLTEIEVSGIWTKPILVETRTKVILDGHHRYWCSEQLDLQTVPVMQVAYDDPYLALTSWREDVEITPEIVLAAAESGQLLPKKTSKHVYAGDVFSCSVPLMQLKRRHAA